MEISVEIINVNKLFSINLRSLIIYTFLLLQIKVM